jgi:hypothetical protein
LSRPSMNTDWRVAMPAMATHRIAPNGSPARPGMTSVVGGAGCVQSAAICGSTIRAGAAGETPPVPRSTPAPRRSCRPGPET